jgi:hypothetical protein
MAYTKKCPAQKPVPIQNQWLYTKPVPYTKLVVCTKPVARGFIPVWVRSAHEILGVAAQPNGDKSPHHRKAFWPQEFSVVTREVL